MKHIFLVIVALFCSLFSIAQTDTTAVDTSKVAVDSICIAKDSAYISVATEDTIQLAPGEKVHEMKEVDVLAEKETQLSKAINASLRNSLELNAPGTMSLSDGIRKLRKMSKSERKRREVENNLLRLEQTKTFEELLNEAVQLQKQLDEQEKNGKK